MVEIGKSSFRERTISSDGANQRKSAEKNEAKLLLSILENHVGQAEDFTAHQLGSLHGLAGGTGARGGATLNTKNLASENERTLPGFRSIVEWDLH